MNITYQVPSDDSTSGQVGLLIVDDSDFIRERLVALCGEIKNVGKILQAENSEQAYNLFNLFSPDVIILDIRISGDNGTGMSKEKVEKLFLIEYAGSTEGTDKEKGTGLGLILCKEFVEMHGGKIWAESEEGIGSRFIFTLPGIK